MRNGTLRTLDFVFSAYVKKGLMGLGKSRILKLRKCTGSHCSVVIIVLLGVADENFITTRGMIQLRPMALRRVYF